MQALASRDDTEPRIRAWAAAIADVEQFALRCGAKTTWVAVCGSRIAGFSDLEPDGHIDMLYVHPERARPVFERQGFEALAGRTVAVAGQEMPHYRMEKRLGPAR